MTGKLTPVASCVVKTTGQIIAECFEESSEIDRTDENRRL